VDIHDRPYEALTATSSALDLVALKNRPASARPDASQGVPPAAAGPTRTIQTHAGAKHWDRERGFVKPVSELPLADLYVCWNRRAIYLGLYGQDVVEESFYRDKIVRASDRAEWILFFSGSTNSFAPALAPGSSRSFDEPSVRLVNNSGLNGDFRNIARNGLPAKLFVKTGSSGATRSICLHLLHPFRGYRVEWKGHFTLRTNDEQSTYC